MKTASFPPLRVEPKLRRDAKGVLRAGETLSSFVEEAIRRTVQDRQAQELFIRRGLAAGGAARESGDYLPASQVLEKLKKRLDEERSRRRRRSRSKRRSRH